MTIKISKIVTVIAMLTLSIIKEEYDSKEEGGRESEGEIKTWRR